MSEIKKIINGIICHDLASTLKRNGYQKNGLSFYHLAESHIAVVNVQAGRYNLGHTGSFTINLGVYFPAVAKISNAHPITGKFPKEYDCTIRQRLGVLMTGGNDYWWSVEQNSDIKKMGLLVSDAWDQYGQPWINQMSSVEFAHSELIKQKQFFVAACISVLGGRKDEARKLIQLAESRQPLAAQKIREWASKNGVV